MKPKGTYTIDTGTELITIDYDPEIFAMVKRARDAITNNESPSFKEFLKVMLWLEEQEEKYPTQQKAPYSPK